MFSLTFTVGGFSEDFSSGFFSIKIGALISDFWIGSTFLSFSFENSFNMVEPVDGALDLGTEGEAIFEGGFRDFWGSLIEELDWIEAYVFEEEAVEWIEVLKLDTNFDIIFI